MTFLWSWVKLGTPLASCLLVTACTGGGASPPRTAGSPGETASPFVFDDPPCGTAAGRGCAPADQRVDREPPVFSHPTKVTNPLFPISELHSAVLLGHVDGKPFRTETTLLPGTQKIRWLGRTVEVLVSQYVAYLDGRLQEVALDRYAQADDGSVWYFGEDVYDYEAGSVAVTEGTWLAGRDGPAAMIMPAHPEVGDAFRTENAPGIVFEEVTVTRTGVRVAGPLGPVDGAIVGRELHTDGTGEQKVFAPGYGEFRTSGEGDLEALAMAVPTDVAGDGVPSELLALSSGTEAILEAARLGEWEEPAATARRMASAWQALEAVGQPLMVAALLDGRIAALGRAVRRQQPLTTEQAALDVAQSALDLTLRYRDSVEVDAQRFHLWTQQLRVDAASRDVAAVSGDVATLEWIYDRFAETLSDDARVELDGRLTGLRSAVDVRNLPASADHAARLGARVITLAVGGDDEPSPTSGAD
jgi:hypothetical protein